MHDIVVFNSRLESSRLIGESSSPMMIDEPMLNEKEGS